MKKTMLLFLVVAVIISMVGLFSLAGCKTTTATETTAAAKQLKFAFSVAILDNPYFVEVANGFKDRCKELGIEAIISDAKYDSATQLSQFETYISSGVDAICAAPVDANGLQDVVKKAKDKGIIVVAEAQGINNADGNVIVNDYDYGVVNGGNAAKWINEKLGGKASVLLITLDNVEAVKLRGNGMADTIQKLCPDAKIVARQYAETTEKAMNITETILQAHPEVNVIDCVNDQHAIGALEATKNMNIKDPNFFIGGADNTQEARAKMVEAGSYFRVTIDIDPYGTGKKCVDVMMDYIKNGSKGETFYFKMTPVWQQDIK
ncbi:MAG: sugar ABC transporter substrate-binding protein [Candidatus Humimicrobiaceae bacterium]